MENTPGILWIGPCPNTDGTAQFAHRQTLEEGMLRVRNSRFDCVVVRPAVGAECERLVETQRDPTGTSVPAGAAYSGAAPTTNTVTVTIGGVPATVLFSGITSTGLYQFNIAVPSAGTGDQLLKASVGGVPTPGGVYVTLQ